MASKENLYIPKPATEDLNILLKSQPELKKILSNIILTKPHRKNESALETLLADKGKTLKATVKALLAEINLRENLDENLITEIDNEVSTHRSQIFHLQDLRVHYDFERFMVVKNLIVKLENQVLELDKEKRQEHLESWRDLMFLKKYLMSALKDYWNLVRKRELLER